MKKFLGFLLSFMCLVCILCTPLYAEEGLEDIFGKSESDTQTSNSETKEEKGVTPKENTEQGLDNEDSKRENDMGDAITGALDGIVNEKNLAKAIKSLEPVIGIVGFCISIGIVALFIALFLITLVDFSAIVIPSVRKLVGGGTLDDEINLNSNGTNGTAQGQMGGLGDMGMGMGGMGLGGMGMGGMRGMGMGGMRGMCGNQQSMQPAKGYSGFVTRWVSDECVASIKEGLNNDSGKLKQICIIYLKKRTFFMLCFSCSVILLFSTVFFKLGFVIARGILTMIAKINL